MCVPTRWLIDLIFGTMIMSAVTTHATSLEIRRTHLGQSLHTNIKFADDLRCCRETLVAMNACHEINNQSTLLKLHYDRYPVP